MTASVWLAVAGVAGAALPEGRHYELVNPPVKAGSAMLGGAVEPDQDRVLFVTSSEFSGGGLTSWLLGTRAADGWHSHSVLPPPEQRIAPGYPLLAENTDFTHFTAGATQGAFVQAPTTVVRLDGSGHQMLLHAFAVGQQSGLRAEVISDDGARAYARLRTVLDPGHVPGTFNVYDVGQQPPVLVSRLPDNTVPICGVGEFLGPNTSTANHWISSDGSRIFFGSRGSDCGTPIELYRRDVNTNATTMISGPAALGTDANATFLQASNNGSAVAYLTSAQLTAADTNSDPDVYVWQGGVNTCLTCAVPDANVGSAAVSEDLSHVYFLSQNQLAAGGADGASNLYVWHNNTIDYVSPTTDAINYPYVKNGGEVTSNGDFFLYSTDAPGIDAISNSQNGGHREYYLYNDHDRIVTCVSCPSGSPGTGDVPSQLLNGSGTTPFIYLNRALSADGSRVFFTTAEPLVREDVNQSVDVYEWHGGQVGLITGGVSVHNALPDLLVGTTSSGNDVFFVTYDDLTPDAVDGSGELFDARVGTAPPKSILGVVCEGDGCQGEPPVAPVVSDPASVGFVGPTDATHPAPVSMFVLGRVSAGSEARLARTGRVTVAVRVSGPGRVSLVARARVGRRTRTVATASRTAHRAGVLTLTLRLSRAARLALAGTGVLRTTITGHYSKTKTTHTATVLLRAPAANHGR